MNAGSCSVEACHVMPRCDRVMAAVAPPPVLLVLAGSGRQSNGRIVKGSGCVTAGQHLSHRVFLCETDMS